MGLENFAEKLFLPRVENKKFSSEIQVFSSEKVGHFKKYFRSKGGGVKMSTCRNRV